ncbi:hypothetical protein [Bacteroides caccae]|nr:hypothetical protein [Bacteroides caccae]MCQ5237996.1 hypothetical protein [Bacteroides caccae]
MVNPYFSCVTTGKQTVSEAEWSAGRGMRRKRMPSCNGTDRG